jgi:hypothetical protein
MVYRRVASGQLASSEAPERGIVRPYAGGVTLAGAMANANDT